MTTILRHKRCAILSLACSRDDIVIILFSMCYDTLCASVHACLSVCSVHIICDGGPLQSAHVRVDGWMDGGSQQHVLV